MKIVILAGGLGTRLSEETDMRPKPMVELNGMPILWHVMKIYSYYGFNDFVILTGYKSQLVKDFFINYYTHYSDLTIDLSTNAITVHSHRSEKWKVTMLYTGLKSMTGARLKIAEDFIGNERFMLTYGDGLSDINLHELRRFHENSRKLATVTAVKPAGRFASLSLNDGGEVTAFSEKAGGDGSWMSGGFFVMEPEVFDYIPAGIESIILEKEPLENIVKAGQLSAFMHYGFFKAMDTLYDKLTLTELLVSGKAPWVKW